jgi:hypothetical protein
MPDLLIYKLFFAHGRRAPLIRRNRLAHKLAKPVQLPACCFKRVGLSAIDFYLKTFYIFKKVQKKFAKLTMLSIFTL